MCCEIIYIYVNFFLIHSSVSGRLDCFHILAVVNSAAIDVGLKYLFLLVFSFSSVKYPELLDHVVVIFEFFDESAYCFRQWLHQFTFLPAVDEDSLFSTSSPALVISCLFDNSHPKKCEVISHRGFNFNFPDG